MHTNIHMIYEYTLYVLMFHLSTSLCHNKPPMDMLCHKWWAYGGRGEKPATGADTLMFPKTICYFFCRSVGIIIGINYAIIPLEIINCGQIHQHTVITAMASSGGWKVGGVFHEVLNRHTNIWKYYLSPYMLTLDLVDSIEIYCAHCEAQIRKVFW